MVSFFLPFSGRYHTYCVKIIDTSNSHKFGIGDSHATNIFFQQLTGQKSLTILKLSCGKYTQTSRTPMTSPPAPPPPPTPYFGSSHSG